MLSPSEQNQGAPSLPASHGWHWGLCGSPSGAGSTRTHLPRSGRSSEKRGPRDHILVGGRLLAREKPDAQKSTSLALHSACGLLPPARAAGLPPTSPPGKCAVAPAPTETTASGRKDYRVGRCTGRDSSTRTRPEALGYNVRGEPDLSCGPWAMDTHQHRFGAVTKASPWRGVWIPAQGRGCAAVRAGMCAKSPELPVTFAKTALEK